MSNFLKLKGIVHQTTCVYKPQQNSVFKRKNRHLLEVTRALMFENNVPKKFWSDAVQMTTYLINRLSSVVLKNKSPMEIICQNKPNINHLRVFGCVCFVHQNKRDRLDYTSIKAIFLSYSSKKKGYKCYDPKNQKLHIFRDVTFFEDESFYPRNNENLDDIMTMDNSEFPNINQVEEHVVLENNEIGEGEGNDSGSNDGEEQEIRTKKIISAKSTIFEVTRFCNL
jgi:hypothetical protein